MVKLVNITSKVAIRTVTPKICGTHRNVLMSTGDILRCILMRAHVEEILSDGSTVILNLGNYNKDNTKKSQNICIDNTVTTDISTANADDESNYQNNHDADIACAELGDAYAKHLEEVNKKPSNTGNAKHNGGKNNKNKKKK